MRDLEHPLARAAPARPVDLGIGPMTAQTGHDIIVTKRSPSGETLFARALDDGGSETGHSVAVDASDAIYVVSRSLSAREPMAASVTRLAPDGRVLWRRTLGVAGVTGSRSAGVVTTNGRGDAVLAGHFTGTIDAGGGRMTSQGKADAFLAVIDRDARHRISKAWGDADRQAFFSVGVGKADAAVSAGSGSTRLADDTIVGSGELSFMAELVVP